MVDLHAELFEALQITENLVLAPLLEEHLTWWTVRTHDHIIEVVRFELQQPETLAGCVLYVLMPDEVYDYPSIVGMTFQWTPTAFEDLSELGCTFVYAREPFTGEQMPAWTPTGLMIENFLTDPDNHGGIGLTEDEYTERHEELQRQRRYREREEWGWGWLDKLDGTELHNISMTVQLGAVAGASVAFALFGGVLLLYGNDAWKLSFALCFCVSLYAAVIIYRMETPG